MRAAWIPYKWQSYRAESPYRHPKHYSQLSEVGVLDVAFVTILVGLAALVIGFATACDRLLGPDEPVLSETGREGAPRTELEPT